MKPKTSIFQRMRDHVFTLVWLVVAMVARNYLASKEMPVQSHQHDRVAATEEVETVAMSDR